MQTNDFNTQYSPTWCPGCGDYGIWAALKQSLADQKMSPDELVIVYGIGCSGNMNDFVKSYGFHSLHGRALPNAIGIRLVNHKLPVFCVVGDGDCYGEGGNHFIHACRGNYNLTVLIHDNRVYGLTTGQAAPTSQKGYESKSTPEGIIETPVNPLALAITQGATFVAQGFAGDPRTLAKLITKASQHKGFAVVNVLQPCVTFNKVNTYQWFQERIYNLTDEEAESRSKKDSLELVVDSEKIPVGIVYKEDRPTYEESLPPLSKEALVDKEPFTDLERILSDFA